MIEVVRHVSRGFSCNTYLCRDEKSGKLLVIDPGTSAEEVLALLSGEKPQKILLTHAHFDHALAAPALREATGAKVCVHRAEAPLLADPEKNASSYFGFPPLSFEADVLLEDGEEILLGASVFHVHHTPGHSPGGVCYRVDDLLFCGDTLFADGVGRTDLFGGSKDALCSSIESLKALEGVVNAFPGHGESFLLSRRLAQENLYFYG